MGFIKYVQVGKRTKIAVDNVIIDYIPNPTFEVVARPGAHMAYYTGHNAEGKTLRELSGEPMRSVPAYRSSPERLALLDELGLDAALMFPTLASLLEVRLTDDPDLTCTILHAFNRWMLDEWGFNHVGRIFATPVVNPCILERGIEELEWVLEHGAKVVLLRPAPVAGYRHEVAVPPEFDPFWARVQESGLLVTLYAASDSGYQRHVNEWEGSRRGCWRSSRRPSLTSSPRSRAISDSVCSAVCHGMLSRFPAVKLASVENGGSWALPTLARLEKTDKMPQEFSEHPRDVSCATST